MKPSEFHGMLMDRFCIKIPTKNVTIQKMFVMITIVPHQEANLFL